MPQPKALPVIRVTKLPPSAKREAPVSKDIQMFDLLLAVVESGNRTQSRVDGIEARLISWKAVLESRGGR